MTVDRERPPDLYQVLSVSPDAAGDEIARAYRRRARALHPDSRPESAAAGAQFRALAEAYHVLGDPGRRAEYDRARRGPAGSGPGLARFRAATAGGPVRFPAATARGPAGAQLWAGPVRVDPPPRRPDSAAEDQSLAALAEVLLRWLGERRDRPW